MSRRGAAALGMRVLIAPSAFSTDRPLPAAESTPDTAEQLTNIVVETPQPCHVAPTRFGSIKMLNPGVTFADVYIFKQWKLTHQPAILIGMDALGMLDTRVIDYKRPELHMRAMASG